MVFREEMTSQSDRRSLSRELLRDVNERVASLASRDEEIRDSGGYVLAPGHRPRLTSVE